MHGKAALRIGCDSISFDVYPGSDKAFYGV